MTVPTVPTPDTDGDDVPVVGRADDGRDRPRAGDSPVGGRTRRRTRAARPARAAGRGRAVFAAPEVLRGRSGVILSVALACVVEMPAGTPGTVRTLAGLWLLLGAPVALWRGLASRVVSTRDSSLMLAVGLAVMTDIVVALGVNTVLPLFGMAHPLVRAPLAGASAMTLVVIGYFAPEEVRARAPGPRRPPRGLGTVAGFGALALVLSVAGPIRLNNGLSGRVSTVALVAIAALLVLLLVRRRRYGVPVLEAGLFMAATALLLLNSLRGWYIVGHDIQREYEFFRLTLGGSLWSITTYPDAYNACLSITLLPVSLVRLTTIPDIYVFKLVLPVLFALTPVMVHRSVRNVAPQFVALLSAVYFMAFPTFFSDMTFLGRQEVAFLLLGCTMMVLTDRGRALRGRRIAFSVLLAGVVLSHYATIYVVVGVLGIAFVVDLLWRLGTRFGPRRSRRRGRQERLARAASFVTWWMVALPAVLALVWAGPVTHTGGQLRSTVAGAVQQVLHPGEATGGSSDTSYSLVGGAKAGPAERLKAYHDKTVAQTEAKRAAGDYLPIATVDAYPLKLAPQQDMPLTAAGRALGATGLDVSWLNGFLRQSAAQLLQVLLLFGLVVTVRARRRVFQPVRDQITLAVGALGVIAMLTVVPQLSVDYGVLRAFQQGLFFFAPFVAAGTLWLARLAGRRMVPLVCVLVAGLFLDLTGMVPQSLGGYPAQLQLNNAGRYHDIYYPSTEERLAVYWLQQRTAGLRPKPVVQAEGYTFRRLQTLIDGPAVGDVFPTVLGTHPYVVLGTNTVLTGEVTFSYQGDLVTYHYPTALLDATKNEIYSSEGARIYR